MLSLSILLPVFLACMRISFEFLSHASQVFGSTEQTASYWKETVKHFVLEWFVHALTAEEVEAAFDLRQRLPPLSELFLAFQEYTGVSLVEAGAEVVSDRIAPVRYGLLLCS